jgi:hypothetical protein
MMKTEDAKEDLNHFAVKLIPGLVGESNVWSARFGGKGQGLLDSQSGEVNIIFRTVNDVSTVLTSNVFWGERIIANFTFHSMVLAALVCDGLKERAATRTRPAKHDYKTRD